MLLVAARFDKGGDRSILMTLIDPIAVTEGISAMELPSLPNSMGLDALTQLFESDDWAADAEAINGFTFKNWNVFVRADGRTLVADGTKPTDPEPVLRFQLPDFPQLLKTMFQSAFFW